MKQKDHEFDEFWSHMPLRRAIRRHQLDLTLGLSSRIIDEYDFLMYEILYNWKLGRPGQFCTGAFVNS